MSDKTEFMMKSSNGCNPLHVITWCKSKEPMAVVQLSHGMIEHIGRYEEFASFLAKRGFAVIGHDHVGHGKSVTSQEEWGYFSKENASELLVEDLHQVTKYAKETYPNVPLVLLGHSMGSFIARRYLMTYGNELQAAILLGTGNQHPLLVKAGLFLTKLEKLIHNENHRSKLLEFAMFGNYNKKIPNKRTSKDWLTKEIQIVDDYLKEAACTFNFTVNGYETLLKTVDYVIQPKNINKIPKELPILISSGDCDPVGEYGKAVKKAYLKMKEAGCKHVTLKLYENDRHELLNETDREQIYEDIYKFISCQI